MRRYLPFMLVLVGVAGCAPGYTRADVVYAEPARYAYVVPVDRVVVVTQDVLVARGWTVYRVQRAGPNRIIWARRGRNEIVRVFATPDRDRVVVRGLQEARGERRGWESRGEPNDIIADIDVRLRARAAR